MTYDSSWFNVARLSHVVYTSSTVNTRTPRALTRWCTSSRILFSLFHCSLILFVTPCTSRTRCCTYYTRRLTRSSHVRTRLPRPWHVARSTHVHHLLNHICCLFLTLSHLSLEKSFPTFPLLFCTFLSPCSTYDTLKTHCCTLCTPCCTFFTRSPRICRILSLFLTLSRFLPLTWFLENSFLTFHCCLILLHVLDTLFHVHHVVTRLTHVRHTSTTLKNFFVSSSLCLSSSHLFSWNSFQSFPLLFLSVAHPWHLVPRTQR